MPWSGYGSPFPKHELPSEFEPIDFTPRQDDEEIRRILVAQQNRLVNEWCGGSRVGPPDGIGWNEGLYEEVDQQRRQEEGERLRQIAEEGRSGSKEHAERGRVLQGEVERRFPLNSSVIAVRLGVPLHCVSAYLGRWISGSLYSTALASKRYHETAPQRMALHYNLLMEKQTHRFGEIRFPYSTFGVCPECEVFGRLGIVSVAGPALKMECGFRHEVWGWRLADRDGFVVKVRIDDGHNCLTCGQETCSDLEGCQEALDRVLHAVHVWDWQESTTAYWFYHRQFDWYPREDPGYRPSKNSPDPLTGGLT